MSTRLAQLDRALMRRALRTRSPGLDRAVVRVTWAANYSRLWFLIAGVLAACGDRRARRAAGRGVVAIVLAAAVANGPSKLLVRRGRPFWRSYPPLIRMPRSTSFPSGHSAAAAAFATGACAEMPGLAPVTVPLAAAVAYSRVYSGVHYPSDVAGGVAIGFCCGLVSKYLCKMRRGQER
jgi:undecaprenyl-diphosphatase